MYQKGEIAASFLYTFWRVQGSKLHQNWAANGGYGWNLPFRAYNIYTVRVSLIPPQRGSLYGGGGGRRYPLDCVQRRSKHIISWSIFDPLCERYRCIISLIPLKKYCGWNIILLTLPQVFIIIWYKNCSFFIKFCPCSDQLFETFRCICFTHTPQKEEPAQKAQRPADMSW